MTEIFRRTVDRSSPPLYASPDLFHAQGACRQWPKERRLRFCQAEPRGPVIPLKDDHLAIMYRRDVGSGRRGEEGEGVTGRRASGVRDPRSRATLRQP